MNNKEKFHFIYKITRKFDNKYYIGMHSTYNIEDGYMGSGILIKESIKEFGVDNHNKEILVFCNSREELEKKEKEIVNNKLLSDINFMNLSLRKEVK